MASYISDYTGKQIDDVVKLFDGKGLIDVEGIIKKNSDGTYKRAIWDDIPKKPTTLDGYGITDAHITNGIVTLGNNTIEPVPTSMVEKVVTDSDSKISTSKAMKTYVDTYGGKIDTISVNGMEKPVVNKNVDIRIPTNTSHLTNDSDFRTGAQVSTAIQTALANGTNPYQTKSNVDTAISAAVSSAYKYKGSVATQQDLPFSGNVVGDVYDVQDNGMNYAWNGTVWDALGQYVDLSVLATKSEVATGLAGKQDTLVSSTNIKTINSQSILGSGDLVIDESVEDVTVDGTSVVSNKIAQINLNGKQDVLVSGTNIKTINNQTILGSGNLVINTGLQNLVDGSTTGSVRGVNTAQESSSYTMGQFAFAEGAGTQAKGNASHAEGSETIAAGNGSHAEGELTQTTADNAHAEGGNTTASGAYSHAEGMGSEAYGISSHAEGWQSSAIGNNSHAQNLGTIASRANQTAIGKYNIEDTETTASLQKALIIGNGTDDSRSNAFTVDWSGNVDIASGASYKINGVALSASDVGAQSTLVSGTNIKTINGDSLLGSGNLIIGGNVDDVTVDGTSVVTNKIAAINLSGKQDTLVSGTNIKTINNQSILGSGNIEVGGGGTSVQSNWTETDTSSAAYILNKPALSTVATSGDYNDLTNKPTLSAVATSGDYTDLTNKPTLSSVAISGDYDDLTNKPTLSTVATSGAYNDLSGKPTLSAVATSGSYNDLTDKPTIPPQLTAGTGITIDSNNVISVNLVSAETQSF